MCSAFAAWVLILCASHCVYHLVLLLASYLAVNPFPGHLSFVTLAVPGCAIVDYSWREGLSRFPMGLVGVNYTERAKGRQVRPVCGWASCGWEEG